VREPRAPPCAGRGSCGIIGAAKEIYTVKRLHSSLLAALFLASLATPAWAGYHYKSGTRTEGAGRGADASAEGWVDGNKAKVLIRESSTPGLTSGTYLLTKDGGKTIYMVDPKEKTYAVWDVRAMLGALGGVMQGIGPLLKFDFSDPKVEKLGEDDGGAIVGYPTRRVRSRTSYTMTVKVFGMGRSNQVVADDETWWTDKLADPGFGVWLRGDPPHTGNAQLDKLIDSQASAARGKGFPLKKVTSQTTTDKNGRKTESKITMEVTLLEQANVPASSFEIPAGYEETEMALPGAVPPSA
jgi:hypothetical protein